MPTAMATATDAELILKLYDLRRETKLREARSWFESKFYPRTWDEYFRVACAFDKTEGIYLRQLFSYWEMAASLVVHGTLNERLFYENCGEMWFLYVKMKPFIARSREEWGEPSFFQNIEKVAEGSAEGRDRVQRMQEHLKHWTEEQEKMTRRETAA